MTETATPAGLSAGESAGAADDSDVRCGRRAPEVQADADSYPPLTSRSYRETRIKYEKSGANPLWYKTGAEANVSPASSSSSSHIKPSIGFSDLRIRLCFLLMICAPLLQVSAPKPAAGFRVCKIRCAVTVAAARPGTLYDELGLRAGATGREIKAAYRRLARERHPDVAGAPAAGDFIRLHDAYATLSDPDSRARYDRDVVALAQRPRPRHRSGAGGRPRRTWETDQCW